MAWNHKTRHTVMAVVVQLVAGTFTVPTTTDFILAHSVQNSTEDITADDPTDTGTIWRNAPVTLGDTSAVGSTIALRGPGGSGVPSADAWVPGRILQGGGWSENRNTVAVTGTAAAGTTTTITLTAGESAVDDFYIGQPIHGNNISPGNGTLLQTSQILDYVGATKVVTLPETLGGAFSGVFTIPKNLTYIQGALTTAPPLLSVRVWKDKQRYDYKDVRITSMQFDLQVANESNTVFPSLEWAGRGTFHALADASAPGGYPPPAELAIDIPPCRYGKFAIDKVGLGHQSLRFGQTTDVAGASNIWQPTGQDTYEIMSGDRTVELDLNQMESTDFNWKTRRDAKTIMPVYQSWGLGTGNNFHFLLPMIRLAPLNPGDRNGFVSLTGSAYMKTATQGAVLSMWFA